MQEKRVNQERKTLQPEAKISRVEYTISKHNLKPLHVKPRTGHKKGKPLDPLRITSMDQSEQRDD